MPFLIDNMYFAAGDRCGDRVSISQDCRASNQLPAAVVNLPAQIILNSLEAAVQQLHEEGENISDSLIWQPRGGSTLAHVIINKLPAGEGYDLYTTSLGDSYLYLVELSEGAGCTLTLLNTLHTPNRDQAWMQAYPELEDWQLLSHEALCQRTASPCRLVIKDAAELRRARDLYFLVNGQPFVYKNKLLRFYSKESRSTTIETLATTRAFSDVGFENMLMKQPECNVTHVEFKAGVSQFLMVASDGISALLASNENASSQLQIYLNNCYQKALYGKDVLTEKFLKAVEDELPEFAARKHNELFDYCDDVCFFMIPLNNKTPQDQLTPACSSYIIADGHGPDGGTIAQFVVKNFPRILVSKLSEHFPQPEFISSTGAGNDKVKSKSFLSKAFSSVARFFPMSIEQESSSSSSSASSRPHKRK